MGLAWLLYPEAPFTLWPLSVNTTDHIRLIVRSRVEMKASLSD